MPDGTVIKMEKAGGINSMRCMRCKTGQATRIIKPNGKHVHKCGSCGAEYAATVMK